MGSLNPLDANTFEPVFQRPLPVMCFPYALLNDCGGGWTEGCLLQAVSGLSLGMLLVIPTIYRQACLAR